MLLLNIALPIEAFLPTAEALAGSAISMARPLAGLSATVAFLMIFKPLLLGLLRAALLLVKPRRSFEERTFRSRLRTIRLLHRTARDFDERQPALASELRAMASRI